MSLGNLGGKPIISGVTAKSEESLAPRRQYEKKQNPQSTNTPRNEALDEPESGGTWTRTKNKSISGDINEYGDFASRNARYRTQDTKVFRQLSKRRTIGSRVSMTVSDWSAWREVAVTGSDRNLIPSMWS